MLSLLDTHKDRSCSDTCGGFTASNWDASFNLSFELVSMDSIGWYLE